MSYPGIFRRLFAHEGAGPMLREDIVPGVKTVNGNAPDAAGNVLLGTANGIVPVGTVIAFAANSAPDGYLICNGAEVSRTTYAALYAAIGTTYGEGDGSTTFTLPNLTDRFIQGSGTAGVYKEAGLPNIVGGFRLPSHGTGYDLLPSGSFYKGERELSIAAQGYEGQMYRVGFSAYESNHTYGASDTVQPPALTMRYYIKY